jgi:oxygen-dependent protoporphyrinogen oxidase
MKRIAILGGGISGLAAAYELELARQRGAEIDWHLYEASDRLGGILETTRLATPEGDFVLEGGPDGWVTDKPWARALAIELGLEADLIYSNDATRKTYIALNGQLLAMPDRMRMMVPEDLSALEGSPLFTAEARAAYAAELTRSAELKVSAPQHDESVSSFVFRHFRAEVLEKIAAPLLAGVFGGDVAKLSVRSVMPAFVAMESEHGSLIAALQAKALARAGKPQQPTFTSLRDGMGSLTGAMIARLPAERLHADSPVFSLKREGKLWCVRYHVPSQRGIPGKSKKHFKHVIVATSVDATRSLLNELDPTAAHLLPTDASSAVLAAFTWPAATAAQFTLPPGFGFLVPPTPDASSWPEALRNLSRGDGESNGRSGETPVFSTANDLEGTPPSGPSAPDPRPSLLACTFVDQKFPHRAPPGARVLRAFFGGASAAALKTANDADIARTALTQLRTLLGPIPEPSHAEVRRWPRSLPQYEVGHLDRMAELDDLVARIGNLTLLGNACRGVGVPDLIKNARESVRKLAF